MMHLSEDLLVAEDVAPKLAKALAVIATRLHQTFDAQPWIECHGKSKGSCVLTSLAVRDFLRAIGFEAQVRTVCTVIQAERGGKPLHSAGIGVPGPMMVDPRNWNGHMVALLPQERTLIDATLFNVKRPAWPNLAGIIAAPLTTEPVPLEYMGMPALAGIETIEGDYACAILWLDRPLSSWRKGPDVQKWRRRQAVDAMTKAFGKWHDN